MMSQHQQLLCCREIDILDLIRRLVPTVRDIYVLFNEELERWGEPKVNKDSVAKRKIDLFNKYHLVDL